MTAPRLLVEHAAAPAHELLRAAAARFHGVRPEQIVLGHRCARCGSDDHGRPVLVPTATVQNPAHVSVARAGDLSIIAITDAGPVGVDVERAGAADFTGFDDVALHPSERGLVGGDRTRAWVRTEALLKAYGLGLAVEPSDVGFDHLGGVLWDSLHPRPGTVWLRDLEVTGHVAAVVVLPPPGLDLSGLSIAATAR